MLNLIQIRQRINAIKSTQKVVEAMRMISISAYPKIHKRFLAATIFLETSQQMLKFLLSTENGQDFILTKQKQNHKTIILVIGANKGLCGAFNHQLEIHARKRFELDPEQHYEFLAIGKQAENIVHSLNMPKDIFNIIPMESLSSHNIEELTQAVKNHIENSTHTANVLCLSNSFKSLFSQQPKLRVILPLENFAATNSEPENNILWEQPSELILQECYNNFLYTIIYNLLLESILSETAARFITTDGAMQNAKTKIEQLSLMYNKVRQAAITREVAELSASL